MDELKEAGKTWKKLGYLAHNRVHDHQLKFLPGTLLEFKQLPIRFFAMKGERKTTEAT